MESLICDVILLRTIDGRNPGFSGSKHVSSLTARLPSGRNFLFFSNYSIVFAPKCHRQSLLIADRFIGLSRENLFISSVSPGESCVDQETMIASLGKQADNFANISPIITTSTWQKFTNH